MRFNTLFKRGIRHFLFLKCNLQKIVFKIVRQEYNFFKGSFLQIFFFYLSNALKKVTIFADAPREWQIGFQDPATSFMQDLICLHNTLLMIFIFVITLIGWLIGRCLHLYVVSKSKFSHKLTQSTVLEIIWTSLPIVLLSLISGPSLSLIHSMENDLGANLTVKIVGHQWYWSYEYFEEGISNCYKKEKKSINFDSYLIQEDQLTSPLNSNKINDQVLFTAASSDEDSVFEKFHEIYLKYVNKMLDFLGAGFHLRPELPSEIENARWFHPENLYPNFRPEQKFLFRVGGCLRFYVFDKHVVYAQRLIRYNGNYAPMTFLRNIEIAFNTCDKMSPIIGKDGGRPDGVRLACTIDVFDRFVDDLYAEFYEEAKRKNDKDTLDFLNSFRKASKICYKIRGDDRESSGRPGMPPAYSLGDTVPSKTYFPDISLDPELGGKKRPLLALNEKKACSLCDLYHRNDIALFLSNDSSLNNKNNVLSNDKVLSTEGSLNKEESSDESSIGKEESSDESSIGKEESSDEESSISKEESSDESSIGKEESSDEESSIGKEELSDEESSISKEESSDESSIGKEESSDEESSISKEESSDEESSIGKEESSDEESSISKEESSDESSIGKEESSDEESSISKEESSDDEVLALFNKNVSASVSDFITKYNKRTLKVLRLLEVDNRLVLPVNTHVRCLVTSGDVLHSWAVPSLGVKVDACPGRLNEVILFLKRPGVFYGQCSEICGVNHGFMPIVVEGVSLNNYVAWTMAKRN